MSCVSDSQLFSAVLGGMIGFAVVFIVAALWQEYRYAGFGPFAWINRKLEERHIRRIRQGKAFWF